MDPDPPLQKCENLSICYALRAAANKTSAVPSVSTTLFFTSLALTGRARRPKDGHTPRVSPPPTRTGLGKLFITKITFNLNVPLTSFENNLDQTNLM